MSFCHAGWFTRPRTLAFRKCEFSSTFALAGGGQLLDMMKTNPQIGQLGE